jgi:hypothetical protein
MTIRSMRRESVLHLNVRLPSPCVEDGFPSLHPPAAFRQKKVLPWGGGLAVLFAGISGLGPCKAEGIPRKLAEGPLP